MCDFNVPLRLFFISYQGVFLSYTTTSHKGGRAVVLESLCLPQSCVKADSLLEFTWCVSAPWWPLLKTLKLLSAPCRTVYFMNREEGSLPR